MERRFLVNVDWDDEAGVYVATSEDLLGLATEAPTLDALMQRIIAVAPELLAANRHLLEGGSFTPAVKLTVRRALPPVTAPAG